MALETDCMTPGANYEIHTSRYALTVKVDWPEALDLTYEQAALFENNIHNALELAIAATIAATGKSHP